MPARPKRRRRVRRIVCRYRFNRVDDQWWAKAYDQGGNLFPEGNFIAKDILAAQAKARDRINNSYCPRKQ